MKNANNQQKKSLDTKDRKLLNLLSINARTPNKKLGKSVGLSEDTVSYRIDKLVQNKVIAKFITYVNIAKIGYVDYGVFLSTKNITSVSDFEKKLSHPNIHYIAKTGGKYDYILGILAKDPLDFEKIMQQILQANAQYIRSRDIAIRLWLKNYPRKYLAFSSESRAPSFGGKIEKIELDDIDHRLLRAISENARESIVQISKKINVPASTLDARLKKMQESGVISGFLALLNPQQYGMHVYDITISVQSPSQEQEGALHSLCEKNKNILYAIKTIGKWDYEIIVELENQQELQNIINQIRDTLSTNLQSIEFVTIFEDIKYTLYPF